MRYKLIMGCAQYIIKFIVVMMLIIFLIDAINKNRWILIPGGVIVVGITVIYIKKRMIGRYPTFHKITDSSRIESNIISTPSPQAPAKLQQMEIENLTIVAADSGRQVVYIFDTLLDGTNTPKRQKIISSIRQEREFDVSLTVESEMTSSYNDVERVKYYSQTIGTIPREISEKVNNKWGRYAISYSINRLKIYTNTAGKYSCHVWVDVLK